MMVIVRREFVVVWLDDERELARLTFAEAEKQLWQGLVAALDVEADAAWVAGATRARAWEELTERRPMYGIDYGPGSVKRRFGGRPPRGAYEFRD